MIGVTTAQSENLYNIVALCYDVKYKILITHFGGIH